MSSVGIYTGGYLPRRDDIFGWERIENTSRRHGEVAFALTLALGIGGAMSAAKTVFESPEKVMVVHGKQYSMISVLAAECVSAGTKLDT